MLKKIMSHVLTLVAADPKNFPLSVHILSDLDVVVQSLSWLSKGKALDLFVDAPVSLERMKNLRKGLAALRIDVFCVAAQDRRKKLLLADMDSTIVVGETLDELSDFAGVKAQVEDITARAMNGEMDFHAALNERVALLKGLDKSALEKTYNAIRVMSGAPELVGKMKENGAQSVLVTGGFTYFADEIGEVVGFDHVHGNQLEIIDGILSGKVTPPILDKHAKLAYLKDYTAKLGLDACHTMAIGDGANDLPMLKAAGLGIGYHPKPVLQDILMNVILHGDLTAALYVQGYAD